MKPIELQRKTAETAIELVFNAYGHGNAKIDTGCGFLDHMLTLFTRHGGFDISLLCTGDTHVDDHHTTEDIGICLGRAVAEAAGDKKGLCRYGSMLLPMDEALILSAVDLSGRGLFVGDLQIPTEKVGSFDTELVAEFFTAFAREARLTLHIRQLSGSNSHHIIEGAFKSVAHSLAAALAENKALEGAVLSTKGVL
ncbi:MAG: imidazoleglycerol-phosphate dehydratase HisB [Ruminococcaceae bacterium]|nr:imidazoleglycerol-phosphate dehydratase HisB [Oscillospiraceae bacterium]